MRRRATVLINLVFHNVISQRPIKNGTKNGKLYIFPIESSFKYSHQPKRSILGKPEIDDVIHKGLSRNSECRERQTVQKVSHAWDKN